MSDWGWHSFANPENYKPEESWRDYDFGRGRKEPYATQIKDDQRKKTAGNWFRVNPHRLHLGTLGLSLGSNPKDIEQVKNIAAQLEEADPAHADAYEANAKAYIEKLTALKDEMHAALDGVPHKDIVTFHEAFPYFAEEFGLHIIGVIEREPGSEPTPEELETTIDQVNQLPVKVLFTEPQYSPSAAETIARETGAKIYELDPVVTGEATPEAADAYLAAMRKNMEVLKQALQ